MEDSGATSKSFGLHASIPPAAIDVTANTIAMTMTAAHDESERIMLDEARVVGDEEKRNEGLVPASTSPDAG